MSEEAFKMNEESYLLAKVDSLTGIIVRLKEEAKSVTDPEEREEIEKKIATYKKKRDEVHDQILLKE